MPNPLAPNATDGNKSKYYCEICDEASRKEKEEGNDDYF